MLRPSMNIIFYILAIIFVIVGVLIYCYIQNLYKISNEIEILQKDIPTDNEIQDMLVLKQPTIFMDVMYEWDAIVEIFDADMAYITEIMKIKEFVGVLETHLSPFSLLFSMGWDYNISDRTPETHRYSHFYLESNHRHLIGQITGTQRILLASPRQTLYITPIETKQSKSQSQSHSQSQPPFNKTHCTIDFWDEKEVQEPPFSNLQFIEIILREGNLIYIPRGWWYLQVCEEPGLVLETVNKSLLI